MSGKGAYTNASETDKDFVGDASEAEPKEESEEMLIQNDGAQNQQQIPVTEAASEAFEGNMLHVRDALEVVSPMTEPKEVKMECQNEPTKPQKMLGTEATSEAFEGEVLHVSDVEEAVPPLTEPKEESQQIVSPYDDDPEPEPQKMPGTEAKPEAFEGELLYVSDISEAVPPLAEPKEESDQMVCPDDDDPEPDLQIQKMPGNQATTGEREGDIHHVGDISVAAAEPKEVKIVRQNESKPQPQMTYVDDGEVPCCSKYTSTNNDFGNISPRSRLEAERIIAEEMEMSSSETDSSDISFTTSELDDYFMVGSSLEPFTAEEVEGAFDQLIEMQLSEQCIPAPRVLKRKQQGDDASENTKKAKCEGNAELESEEMEASEDSASEATEFMDDDECSCECCCCGDEDVSDDEEP